MSQQKLEAAKNIGDVIAGIATAGVVLGWIHILVGVLTATYTLARFYGWWERRVYIRRERRFYIDELTKANKHTARWYTHLPVDELRKLYERVCHEGK